MRGERQPCTGLLHVTITVDGPLRAAAAWHGLSLDAYVRSVVAAAARDDEAMGRFARESLDADPDALSSQDGLDRWFEAHREPSPDEQ
jgi:hypothetical protein